MAVAVALGLAGAGGFDYMDSRAVRDSVRNLHPRLRESWLRDRGLEDPFVFGTIQPESSGLRLVGKYGRGSAVEVTGRDSLVVLTLGSEAAIVNFARPDSPAVLSEIQFGSVTVQSRLCDSTLYIGGYGAIEAWDVSDPADPEFRSRIPLGVSDFCVQDTFLFLMRQDTFRVYSVADPAAPRQLGWYRDSAVVFAASGNTVVCGHPRQGLILVDVSDPVSPHRAGTVSGWALSAEVRGNLCCVTFGNPDPYELTLRIFDIGNPTVPVPLGQLGYCGGYDMHLDSEHLYLSGYYTGDYGFQVVDISDSTTPQLVGECVTGGQGWGVWVNGEAQRGYVAGKYGGLIEIDISSRANPTVIGAMLQADAAYDVAVNGNLAYVADYGAGLHILDISDPTRPRQLGMYDTAGFLPGIQTCEVRDSFAFVNWYDGGGSRRYLRSVDVSDPANPVFAGDAECQRPPEDMVLQDSFLYVAEDYRFEVFNVARPREPVHVGSCILPYRSWHLTVADTLAYVGNITTLVVVNVAQPSDPSMVGAWWRYASGVQVQESTAFVVGADLAFWSLNVADPTAPSELDTVLLGQNAYDIVLLGTSAFAAENYIHVVDVTDPCEMQRVGSWSAPEFVRGLNHADTLIGAACMQAGVAILETTATAVMESPQGGYPAEPLRVTPTVTQGLVVAEVPLGPGFGLSLYDALGRVWAVPVVDLTCDSRRRRQQFDLSALPAGVYYLTGAGPEVRSRIRVVKLPGR